MFFQNQQVKVIVWHSSAEGNKIGVLKPEAGDTRKISQRLISAGSILGVLRASPKDELKITGPIPVFPPELFSMAGETKSVSNIVHYILFGPAPDIYDMLNETEYNTKTIDGPIDHMIINVIDTDDALFSDGLGGLIYNGLEFITLEELKRRAEAGKHNGMKYSSDDVEFVRKSFRL